MLSFVLSFDKIVLKMVFLAENYDLFKLIFHRKESMKNLEWKRNGFGYLKSFELA
jgi:hypothetical protein